MKQPAATVTAADVERIVARDFPADLRATVLEALATYGAEDHEPEPDRVRAAILRLAAGNLEELRRWVGHAKADFRDPLCAAEYPHHSKKFTWKDREKEEKAMCRDYEEYQAWFAR